MKKNLIYLLALSVGVMSCSKNETVRQNTAEQDANKISFSTAIGKQTKATEVKLKGMAADGGFKCISYINYRKFAEEPSFSNIPVFNLQITSADEGLTWTPPADTYLFWPQNSIRLTAFSYSPTVLPAGGDIPYTDPLHNGTNMVAPTIDYTVAATSALQKDLVAASTLDKLPTTDAGKLVVVFKHILSQIRFTAKTVDPSYLVQVKKIVVNQAFPTGKYSFPITLKNIDDSDNRGSWVASGTRADYAYYEKKDEWDMPVTVECGETATEIDAANVLMLIPQDKDNAFTFTVTYDITTRDGISLKEDVVATANMEALEVGKKYVYNLTLPLSPDVIPLTFSVAMDEWEPETPVNAHFREKTWSGDNIFIEIIKNTVKEELAKFTAVTDICKINLTAADSGTKTLGGDVVIDLSTENYTNFGANDYIIINLGNIQSNAKKITFKIPFGYNLSGVSEKEAGSYEVEDTVGSVKIVKNL